MSLKISIIVEGATEEAFLPALREFVKARMPSGSKPPRLDTVPQDGRIPMGDKLRRMVENLLRGKHSADAVIALTDVYTGTREFVDAADAKSKLAASVPDEARFHAHAAQHDFEAGLIPYWDTIKTLARSNRKSPARHPEAINHDKPPSRHLQEVFRTGRIGKSYVKSRDGARILREQDLGVAVNACPELKAFLNTILSLSGGEPLP